MQKNINDFITEYEQWAGQEKYKDFDFISKSLSPKWKDRLLTNKKFNLWATIFGPLYRMSLGGAVSGVLLLLLEIFLACLVDSFSNDLSLAVLSVFAFNTLFSLNINKVYVKQKQAFKKKMQDFDPTATIEYFNISRSRLIILTLLTAGFYLTYWFYRQSKAIKVSQKDNSISPLFDALFFVFCANRIFNRMAISFGKPKGFNPKLSATAILVLPILIYIIGEFFGMKTAFAQTPEGIEEMMKLLTSTRTILTAHLISTWLIVVVLSLIVCKWQSGIQTYCKKMQLEKSKFSGWEVFWVILGGLGQYELFSSTYLCFMSWQNINNLLPLLVSALQ